MIIMHLLEGEDYKKTYDDYASCLQFCEEGCQPEVKEMKRVRSEFFHQLWVQKKGGILVAQDECGQVLGWFSFLDKETAKQILWPTRRQPENSHSLVGGCLLVDPSKRGLGIGTSLAEELKELAKEWGYHGVEVACRDADPYDAGLNWHTPSPFRNAGYREVERYSCEKMYPADFIIMEYMF